MSIWETLDIAPTRDEAAIRRAYARRLKSCRPDRDPEGYQQLREAFDEAKRQAAAQDEPGRTEEPVDISVRYDDAPEPVHQEPAPALPEADTFYCAEDMQTLAHQLVHTEMMGVVRLTKLWSAVSARGSLGQQQRFHQDLALALAEQPGLTEGLVERVASQLEWGLDDYDYSHIIPRHVQDALHRQLRETELERARRQLDVEEKHGSIMSRMALRLLRSDRQTAPFWLRLIPGAIATLSRQVNHLLYYYPEMASQLNPAMLAFIEQPRAALSWQGIYLLGFWSLVFNAALQIAGVGPVVGATAIAIVAFYLYVSDITMLALRPRPGLLGSFMVAESLFSSVVMLLFFGGLFAAAILSMPGSGHGAKALVAVIYIFVLMIVFRAAWPKNVPLVRKPGIAMSRVFSSPWQLIVWLNYSWFSLVWCVIYCAVCVIVVAELLKPFSAL